MSTFKSFALIGANGHIGQYILKAFLAINIQPLIITRKTSDSTFPSNTTVARVDLDNVEEVSQTLQQHGIEVLVSTVTPTAIESQHRLADAAKKGGVKLFVPSEFGFPVEDYSDIPPAYAPALAQKQQFADYLKSIGLPWVRFHTGFFFNFVPWIGAVEENGKFNIEKGKEDVELTVTHEDDIGGFVAHVLTTLSPKDLEYRSFYISGEEISLESAGKRINKEVESVEVLPGSGPTADFKRVILSVLYTGQGVTTWDYKTKSKKQGATDNHIWAGHEWKKL